MVKSTASRKQRSLWQIARFASILRKVKKICQRDIRMSVQGYGANAAFQKFRVETGNIEGGITEKAVFGAHIGSIATPFPAYHGNQERTHSIIELRRSDGKDNANPNDPPRFRD